MTTFAYNNNVHLNIDRAFNEFFKNYIANFANKSENKHIKKKTFLIIKKIKWLRNNKKYLRKLSKKVIKKQKLSYNAHHKSIIFNKNKKVFLRNINIRILRFKKNWSSLIKIFYYNRESKFANVLFKIFKKVLYYSQRISCVVFKVIILARRKFKIVIHFHRK